MPAESAPQQGLTIRPLTFLQVYRTVGPLHTTHNGSKSPVKPGDGDGSRGRPLPALQPLVYHLAMSGYGAFDGQDSRGWMFLRGSHQVLVVDSLHTADDEAAPVAADALLGFAERQARLMRRRWLGALVEDGEPPGGNGAFAARGFQGRSVCVYRAGAPAVAPKSAVSGDGLRVLSGSRGELARARFARAALALEDSADGEYLARFLLGDVVPVRHWLVEQDGGPVAYLGSGVLAGRPVVEVLTGSARQAEAAILAGLQQVLAHVLAVAGHRREIELRIAGSEQAAALQAGLAALGFAAAETCPVQRLYKELLAV